MSTADFATYTARYDQMTAEPHMRAPDAVVYLTAPFDEILKRIRRRDRRSERRTDPGYWQALHDRYTNWAAGYTAAPLITLDVRAYDFWHDGYAGVKLAEAIGARIGHEKMVRSTAIRPLAERPRAIVR